MVRETHHALVSSYTTLILCIFVHLLNDTMSRKVFKENWEVNFIYIYWHNSKYGKFQLFTLSMAAYIHLAQIHDWFWVHSVLIACGLTWYVDG